MSLIKQLNYSNNETFLEVKKLQKAVMQNPNSVKTDTLLVNQIDPLKGYLVELKEKKDDWTLYRIEFSIKKEIDSEEFIRAIKFLAQCDEVKKLAQVIGYFDLKDGEENSELPDNYLDYRLYEELNLLFENEVASFLGSEEEEMLVINQANTDLNNLNNNSNIF